jgi:hypothetical protein
VQNGPIAAMEHKQGPAVQLMIARICLQCPRLLGRAQFQQIQKQIQTAWLVGYALIGQPVTAGRKQEHAISQVQIAK